MEKLDRTLACDYLVRANEISDFTNHEIVRAYGWSQYWLGNREKGIQLIRMAHDINHLDAEVIYNLTELSLLERDYGSTREMLDHYSQYHDTLQTFDKPVEYYDEKMELFENYLTTKIQ
jgi:tetratricopeptide (TPR) repeat protein